MDAIDLLVQQHEAVTEMMNELKESSPGRERNETFKKLQHSLLAHMVVEEELCYPALSVGAELDRKTTERELDAPG